jgi:hypothetical protein
MSFLKCFHGLPLGSLRKKWIWAAMPISTQPISLRTQIIQPPERGSFSNSRTGKTLELTGKYRQDKQRQAEAETEGEKDEKTEPGAAHARHPGEQAEYERTDAGSGNHAEGQAHEETAKVAGIGFCCRLGEPAGQAHLPQAKEAGGEKDQDGGYTDQHQRALQQ